MRKPFGTASLLALLPVLWIGDLQVPAEQSAKLSHAAAGQERRFAAALEEIEKWIGRKALPGDLASRRAIMHTGFTGTSIYIDPDREAFVILLTNRVHPTRRNGLIFEARPAIHTAVLACLNRMP